MHEASKQKDRAKIMSRCLDDMHAPPNCRTFNSGAIFAFYTPHIHENRPDLKTNKKHTPHTIQRLKILNK